MFSGVARNTYLSVVSLAAVLLVVVYAHALPDENAPLTCRLSKFDGPFATSTPVAWAATTASAGQTKLDQWCRTVGPALVRTPERARPSNDGRILVVDWNVHVGNGNIEALIRELKTKEQIAGRDNPEFVFLLQEAFRRSADVPAIGARAGKIPSRIQSPESDIRAIANRLDWWMVYVPSMRNGNRSEIDAEDRGNAILSSLPLDTLQAIELPFSVQRRVAVAAIVNDERRDLRFRVTSLHLDTRAPLTAGSFLGAPSARNHQAKHIANFFDRLADDNLAMIIGGDLNSYWGPLESSMGTLSSIAPHLNCGTRTHSTGLTLDHVFARLGPNLNASSCGRASDRFDSDHFPLVLSLTARLSRSAR